MRCIRVRLRSHTTSERATCSVCIKVSCRAPIRPNREGMFGDSFRMQPFQPAPVHGRELTTVQTNHKPLVPIFQKSLHSAPKRLQWMLLRLQKCSLHVKYLPGPQMYIVNMLSRAYLQADHSQHENIPEYQIFQLRQEQQLFQ